MTERLSAKVPKPNKDTVIKPKSSKPKIPAAKSLALKESEPKLGRRERNRLEKLARITDAARILFREKGFQGTTINDIAEAADIGFGTLFLYAKSKEELLVMVFKDEMMEVVDKTYAKMPKKPLLDQVMFLFAGFVTYHKRDEALSRALLKEIFFLDNPERRLEVMRLMHSIFGRLADLIKVAQNEGKFNSDADPVLLARNLFSIYIQQLNAWLGGYTNYARFEKLLPEILNLQIKPLQITQPKSPQKRSTSS
ncbi:MAG: TetR/AcrR family transcriptional regulator [Parvibaculum sp.]|nr:TetR/AcrR family transcriptional regulator [Parvibaculum sp.]